MRDHKPSCAVHGRGHRTTRDGALASWSGSGRPLSARVISVADDGIVLDVAGEEVTGWHHDLAALRRALATGKPPTYQHDVRLLHVGGPYDALGPWAFSLADPFDHQPCSTRAVRARRPRPSPGTLFCVPFGPGSGRPMLVSAVARLLEDLEHKPVRQALIVSIAGHNLFTQALISSDEGAWLEAVSNEFIDDPRRRLGDDQHILLAASGYRPPTPTLPNHHQPIDRPATFVEVAELLVAPLGAVYGLGPDDQVRVDVFPAPGY